MAGLIILAFPNPLRLETFPAQGSERPHLPSEAVFQAVVGDFALLSSLLDDVAYVSTSIYPVVRKVDTCQEAIDYLSAGFAPDLAASITNYYLAWDKELQRLVVIPTDSIPLITEKERGQCRMVFISPHHAVVQCLYSDCYVEGDSYIYTVHLQKVGIKWQISKLVLEEKQVLADSGDYQTKYNEENDEYQQRVINAPVITEPGFGF